MTEAPSGNAPVTKGDKAENPPPPDLRHTEQTREGPIEVEETSGSAFAEVTGADRQSPPDAEAHGGVEDETLPANAKDR